jgi:DNA-binding transcriptional MerR regulator
MSIIDLTKEAFNTKQVCKIIGATERKIRHWDKQGLVKPSVSPASGRGSRRLYCYQDLLALKTVKSLRDDVSLQKIRRCVSFLRQHLPDLSQPLNMCTLVAVGESLYLVRDEKTLVDTVTRPGQCAHRDLIDIAEYDRQLRKAIVTLVRKRVVSVNVGDYAYQVEIEPDNESGGYIAQVAGLPGCLTQGDTLEETLEMVEDAIRTYLEAVEDLKKRGVNLPIKRRRAHRAARA